MSKKTAAVEAFKKLSLTDQSIIDKQCELLIAHVKETSGGKAFMSKAMALELLSQLGKYMNKKGIMTNEHG